jgi:uncharacterized membrane protein YedE/YeeE
MTIDWAHFTPFSALGGGAMIGAAAGLLILVLGRIMGAAGILGRALDFEAGDWNWRWWLIAGLVLSPAVVQIFWAAQAPAFASSWALLTACGLLVGFGARLGSGCTSGHGVCGISRVSPRSFVATAVFMTAGFVMTFLIRHGFA